MTTVQDVNNELVNLQTAIQTATTNITAGIAAVHAQVTALQAQVAGGAAVSVADLDNFIRIIKDLETQVTAIPVPAVFAAA